MRKGGHIPEENKEILANISRFYKAQEKVLHLFNNFTT